MASSEAKPLVIVYHANCIDGAACAWTVAKAARGVDEDPEKQKNVTYIPYGHHNRAEAEEQIRAALKADTDLYFVDVAPTKQFLDELMTSDEDGNAKVSRIRIMDHHESEIRNLRNYKPPETSGIQPGLDVHLDSSNHSAAKMVWEDMMGDAPPPEIFALIDKMDGDAKGLTNPRDFAAAAYVDNFDISTPTNAFQALRGLATETFNMFAKAGGAIVRDHETRIDKLLDNAVVMRLQILPGEPAVDVAVANGDVRHFGRQVSLRLVQAGDEAGSGVAFSWFMQKNGAVTMSIRTNGHPDASLIADHLRTTMGVTGGGHEGAGAVHFRSLFDFARNMPFSESKPLHVSATPANLVIGEKPTYTSIKPSKLH